jgi:AraC family transcriptional regulator of adaptative response / DNA-3-methyladenine glycosylase II
LTVEASLRPRGPYSLALTARRAGDSTRTFRDGVVEASIQASGRLERVRAWQQPDGVVLISAETDEGIERMRFVLALDDDHTPFLRRCRHDPLLRETSLRLGGLRQMRLATVAHALLRALCGQLITARQARLLERRIVASLSPDEGRLHHPPTAADLGSLAPARLRQIGLHARRAASLVRLCRELDLERLRSLPTEAVEARLLRERGIGPWSVGVVCLEGLGRSDRGLVGDLGLIKLLSALRGGAWVEGPETAELLEPYEEWAGLASVYLLAGFGLGLVPLPATRAA